LRAALPTCHHAAPSTPSVARAHAPTSRQVNIPPTTDPSAIALPTKSFCTSASTPEWWTRSVHVSRDARVKFLP